MIIKIIKFLIIHFLDKNDDFLALCMGRDEFTDYQIVKITYDKDGMKTYGTRDCREEKKMCSNGKPCTHPNCKRCGTTHFMSECDYGNEQK